MFKVIIYFMIWSSCWECRFALTTLLVKNFRPLTVFFSGIKSSRLLTGFKFRAIFLFCAWHSGVFTDVFDEIPHVWTQSIISPGCGQGSSETAHPFDIFLSDSIFSEVFLQRTIVKQVKDFATGFTRWRVHLNGETCRIIKVRSKILKSIGF